MRAGRVQGTPINCCCVVIFSHGRWKRIAAHFDGYQRNICPEMLAWADSVVMKE